MDWNKQIQTAWQRELTNGDYDTVGVLKFNKGTAIGVTTAETLFKPISEGDPIQKIPVEPVFLSETKSEILATEKDTSIEPKRITARDDEKLE